MYHNTAVKTSPVQVKLVHNNIINSKLAATFSHVLAAKITLLCLSEHEQIPRVVLTILIAIVKGYILYS